MRMMKLAAFAAGLVSLVGSSQAMAAVYAYPTLTNNDPSGNISVTNVSWSGSYNPQISATVTPGQTSYGTLKSVSGSYSRLDFRASITRDGVTRTCAFSLTLDNSTGAITATQAVRWTGEPTCVADTAGNFSMKWDSL